MDYAFIDHLRCHKCGLSVGCECVGAIRIVGKMASAQNAEDATDLYALNEAFADAMINVEAFMSQKTQFDEEDVEILPEGKPRASKKKKRRRARTLDRSGSQ